MASPLLRNLFNDFPSLRGKRQRVLDQNVKAPIYDPASMLNKAKEPLARNLRPRHTTEDTLTAKTNETPPTATCRSSLHQRKSLTQDTSKPLPPLPSAFPTSRKTKKTKKRKLPRAVTERDLPHSRSKLHLSSVPGQDLTSPSKAPLQVHRFASPFDDLSDHEQNCNSSSDHYSTFQNQSEQIHEQGDQNESVKFPLLDFKPTSLELHKKSVEDINSTQPSAWLASSLDSRVLEYKDTCATMTQDMHLKYPKIEPRDFAESNDEMASDQVIESIEVERLALCGHPLIFHRNQQTILDCNSAQRNDGETILTSADRLSCSGQASPANNGLLKDASTPMISPPPSFRRSTARTSRLQRSPTSFFTSSTSSSLPLTPQRVRSEAASTTLDMDPDSGTNTRPLERSPTDAALTLLAPQNGRMGSPMPQAVSPCPPPRQSRAPTGPDLRDNQTMLAQTKSIRYLTPESATALSDREMNEANLDNADFFTTYYDAMVNGTEHSWTLALRNSDLGDKAISDALLSDLPKPMLLQYLQQKTALSGLNTEQHQHQKPSQMDGTCSDQPSVYTFGSTADTYCTPLRRSSRGGQVNTSPTMKTVLQGRELRELELLSPIREERESQNSLLAPRKATVNKSIDSAAHKTGQYRRGTRYSNRHGAPGSDQGPPACTQCTSRNTQCSCSSKPDPAIQSPSAQPSMAHRQQLLVRILATAGAVYQPFARIQSQYRLHGGTIDKQTSQLTLGGALDAVIDSIHATTVLLTRQAAKDSGIPVRPDSQTAYYGALALVLACVIALESAATTAEAEGGVMLRLKTSRNAEHVEFVNRVFEVLAAFGADKVGPSGGATLGVLESCIVHVDEALWRLWEQMEGGLDENGMAMGDEIHWDVMVEVAREMLCRGFVDASKLGAARLAVEKVARLEWMQARG